MRTLAAVGCVWMTCLVWVAAQGAGRQPRPAPTNVPEKNPFTSPADLEMGRRLYQGRCGHCHGQEGEGGRGAVLNSGRFRQGGSDRELFMTIRNGIPNTEMPGAFNLPEMEVWRIVAHVQQLGRQGASEPSLGDPRAGALVYEKSACATCHTIDGKGSFAAPDLTDVGAKRAVRHIRESLVNPSADIPLDYRSVTVVDKSGKTTSGIHLNEDEYSVHLRELNGTLRSFLKSELSTITLSRQSLMPPYTALSTKDLEDLVAYLSSLRPEKLP
jgi:putative heme-binding domain-containing protein